MLKISVCDDNMSELKHTEQLLYKFYASHNSMDISIKIFNSPSDLMEKISSGERYNIYILDIMMPDFTGIDIGEQIRKNDEYAYIIYLTSSESYALKSYQVRAFQYLLKPVSEVYLFNVLETAINRIDIENSLRFTVNTNNGIEVIAYHHMISAEYYNHSVKYNIIDRQPITSSVLRTPFDIVIEELVKDIRFLRCHNSFLINMQHVKTITNKDFIMTNNIAIPIASSKYKQIKENYLDYIIRNNE
ncbi:MAG: response regulator transcription factor [Clostridia bacterium]|nr:response regulator transcription factor [Clostridia bacterium]